MSRMKIPALLCLIMAAALLVVLCVACGSSTSSSLSAAQAQAVSSQLLQAVALALENAIPPAPAAAPAATGEARPSLSTVVTDIYAAQSSGCIPSGTGESCDWPVNVSEPCPGGGIVGVTGDVNGTLNNSGSGSISTQLTVTPASCSVSNLVINGDPNVMIGAQINFVNSALAFPVSLTEHGGISYGPHPSGSCQVNVTYTVNSLTSCTATGTVCGHSVSGSC